VHTDIYALSGIRTHDPSIRGKTVYALDHATTVIGSSNLNTGFEGKISFSEA
jgi:hypothetical protein